MEGLRLVGGGVLSAVADRIRDKSLNYLEESYQLQRGTKEQLDKLVADLTAIRSVVSVAESKLICHAHLTIWLSQFKDAAYEAEDLIDDFETRVIRQRVNRVNGKRKVGEIFTSTVRTIKNLLLPDEDVVRLEGVVRKLDQLLASARTFVDLVKFIGVDSKGKSGAIEGGESRETSSCLPNDTRLFGRADILKLLLDMVLGRRDEPESSGKVGQSSSTFRGLDVIPIAGPGGVGKTTLAQFVYNNDAVIDHFSRKFWVYVSDDFNVKRIEQVMRGRCYGSSYLEPYSFTDLDSALKSLGNFVLGERFLLVLDDVHGQIGEHWHAFFSTLRISRPGSIVIVTTQSKRVASAMGTVDPICLNMLDWDDFWQLFNHHAFGNTKMDEYKRNKLQIIGRKIAEKLHGLPLAAKVIGNLLRSDSNEKKWAKISESEWWNLTEGLGGILPSLGVSYHQLEPGKRQCFSFCSIFPKNYMFEKERLVQMWIAHDFIQTSRQKGVTLEDVGRQWFDELVEKSFFQPTWSSKWYTMHGLMRDLATAVSLDECSYLTGNVTDIQPSVRHLSVETDDPDVVRNLPSCKNLRTFLFFGNCVNGKMYYSIASILYKFKGLRVLDLSYLDMKRSGLPSAIRYLLHLRFLDVSYTNFPELPESIYELYHLQVLNLKGCSKGLNSLDSLTKLINLRHLYMDPITLSQVSHIGQLTNLQELERFHASERDGHKLIELKDMNEISGNIDITGLDSVPSREEAISAHLKNKNRLSSLVLHATVSKEILEGLQPHENLEELSIENYSGKHFPCWMRVNLGFINLQTVNLKDCRMLEELPPFGQLPSLRVLSLELLDSVKQINHNFYGNSVVAFQSLEELSFRSLESCTSWAGLEGREIFPKLKQLVLNDCPRLEETPFHSWKSLSNLKANFNLFELPSYLEVLTSLTHLEISGGQSQHNFGRVQSEPPKLSLCFCRLVLLQHLRLSNCELKVEIIGLSSLVNLRSLYVINCHHLLIAEGQNPEQLQQQVLQSLTHLNTDHSLLIRNNYLALGTLPSVRFMKIRGDALTSDHNAWFQQLSSLEELEFYDGSRRHQHPTFLGTLTSLKVLHLNSPGIQSLPEYCVPPGLQKLYITHCSGNLHKRCKPSGEDWLNIAHVPYIRIKGQTIQALENAFPTFLSRSSSYHSSDSE